MLLLAKSYAFNNGRYIELNSRAFFCTKTFDMREISGKCAFRIFLMCGSSICTATDAEFLHTIFHVHLFYQWYMEWVSVVVVYKQHIKINIIYLCIKQACRLFLLIFLCSALVSTLWASTCHMFWSFASIKSQQSFRASMQQFKACFVI